MGSVESKEVITQEDEESRLWYIVLCSVVIGVVTIYFILRKKGTDNKDVQAISIAGEMGGNKVTEDCKENAGGTPDATGTLDRSGENVNASRVEVLGDRVDEFVKLVEMDQPDGCVKELDIEEPIEITNPVVTEEIGKSVEKGSENYVEVIGDESNEPPRPLDMEYGNENTEEGDDESPEIDSQDPKPEPPTPDLIESGFDEQTASEEWEDKPLKKSTSPYSLRVSDIMSDSVTLKWVGIEDFDAESSYYQVRFKEPAQRRWTTYRETSEIDSLDIKGLKSDCSYIFQVRVVIDDEEGKYSDPTDEIKTKQSLAFKLLDVCTKVNDGNPSTYVVNSKEILNARDPFAKTRKMEIGSLPKIVTEEKTILLIGATGSGKSTLVDGIINFVAGVNWNDPYRFKLVNLEKEEEDNIENQAISQTEWITTYRIHPAHGGRLKYSLNIIDTPGFGDTRGIDRDREIIDQLRNVFSCSDGKGVSVLDAVCFIVKAPDARLTHSQKYVFMQILSLFGQDIEENIMYLITFADGEAPPVLAAMKEAKLPERKHFVFNNSGLFASNTKEHAGLSPMFWEMGVNSFRTFFESLKCMPPKSLTQTKEVLNERERISVTIANLRQKVDAGLCKLSDLDKDIEQLVKYETQIAANKDFLIEGTETKQVEVDIPVGTYITNCLQCNRTCHYPCGISDDYKKGCAAMDCSGNCRECSKKCSYTQHRNGRKKLDYVQIKVKRTLTEMEAKYKQAGEKKLSVEEIIKRKQIEIETIFEVVLDLMKNVNEANNRLKEIALRPDPLTMVEHINLMIHTEEDEKKPGYLDRIKMLQRYRKEAEIDKHISNFEERLMSSVSLKKNANKGILAKTQAKIANFFGLKYSS